jgi:8-oxo-dGTP diphosphatase
VRLLEVVAGILLRDDDHVLIAERTGDSPFAGLWEFPGGKIVEGERLDEALARELREELGVSIREWSHLQRLDHRYDDRHVRIDFYIVSDWIGSPQGLDGQALRWVHATRMRAEELLPADAPVVEALKGMVAGA